MKNIITFIIFTILITAFTVQRLDSPEIIQMVISLPDISSRQLETDIERDVRNLSGVTFVDISLMSKSIIINYNSQKVSSDDILNILDKWECRMGNSSFNSIIAMQ